MILVVGGTGNIGAEVLCNLADAGLQANGLTRDPITLIHTRDVRAVAACVLASLGHDAQISGVTASNPLSHSEMAAQRAATLGRPVRFLATEPDAVRASVAASKQPPIIAETAIDGQRRRLLGFVPPAIDMVRQLLERDPVTFDQLLPDHLDLFNVEGAAA